MCSQQKRALSRSPKTDFVCCSFLFNYCGYKGMSSQHLCAQHQVTYFVYCSFLSRSCSCREKYENRISALAGLQRPFLFGLDFYTIAVVKERAAND